MNRNLALQLAQGTGMTATGGNGVVILSRISTLYQADCDASGFSATCGNLGQAVFTQRLAIGNTALRASAFGTPNSALINAQGNISPSGYLQDTDSTTRATGFTPLLTAAGETQAQGDAA